MVLAFALDLLWLFFPQERNGFPFFIHRCSPDQPPLAPGVPKQIILGAYYLVPFRHVGYVPFECLSINCLSDLIPNHIALPPSTQALLVAPMKRQWRG